MGGGAYPLHDTSILIYGALDVKVPTGEKSIFGSRIPGSLDGAAYILPPFTSLRALSCGLTAASQQFPGGSGPGTVKEAAREPV